MKKAFTLIELMVVIGLVVLLSIGTIAGISSARSKKQVKATAERLRSYLADNISWAVNPNDTDFGIDSLQIRVYPNNFSLPANPSNFITVYQHFRSGPLQWEQKIPVFKMTNGMFVNVSSNPASGNMSCFSTNPPCPSPGIDYYYYFTVPISTPGVFSDVNHTSDPLVIVVSDVEDQTRATEKYNIKIFPQSGLVTVEKAQ